MSIPVKHPYCNKACQAMVEYQQYARRKERIYLSHGLRSPITHLDKVVFADKHNTTTTEMDIHERCAERLLGKDPNDRKPDDKW